MRDLIRYGEACLRASDGCASMEREDAITGEAMRVSVLAVLVLSITFWATDGRAKRSDTVPLELYTACFRDALNYGYVEEAGKSIVFTCRAPAEAFFKALGDAGVATVDEGNRRKGIFRTRYMRPPKGDRCYEQTSAVGGAPMSAYSCQLFFPAGLILKR